ncbi:MAG: GHKL domain-containing protein [Oscillospiraceae bacterium]|nr:GHKL domain-containing protein [Oscillospiraceae bacterium]
MLMKCIVLLSYMLEFLISFFFLNNLFSRKKKLWQTLLFGILIYCVCCASFLFDNVIFNTTLFTIANIVFALLFFETRIKGAFLSAFFLTAAEMATEFIVMNVLSLTTSKDINVYLENSFMFLLMVILSKISFLLVSRIALIAGLYLNGHKKTQFPFFLLIYPLCSILILYVFFIIAERYNISHTIEIAILFGSIAIVLSIFLTYIFYSKTQREIDELFIAQQDAERIKTDTAYYALLDSQNEMLKTITHDEKNHLSVIKSLANSQEINAYIDTIYNEISFHSLFGNTKNKYLDLLINKYQSVCDTNGISFDTSIKTANLAFMEAPDIITLISNILDNAVEAAKPSIEKRIDLSINHVNNFDVLTCSNSCDKKPSSSGKTLHTTKSSEGFHGFGIKSIKRITDKYNGEFDWFYHEDAKEFVINIVFFYKD